MRNSLNVLREVMIGKRIGTHPIRVKYFNSERQLDQCSLVFFPASERRHTPSVVAALNHAAILLVGEGEEFLQQGGMISLVSEGGRMGFEINLGAAQRAGLRLSSRLLLLAKTVVGSPGER